jgi:hypothetical protein
MAGDTFDPSVPLQGYLLEPAYSTAKIPGLPRP